MKVLLDESLPIKLAKELISHKVSTVVGKGWKGKKNGELLKLAEAEFDAFITVDQNLPHQANLIRTKIAVIIIRSKTNRFEDLKPLIPKILSELKISRKGIIRL